MFCGWILLLVFQVFLLLLCPGNSRCALDYPPDGSKAQYKHFEKRYDDVDYDSFIGLMGRRSTGPNHSTNSPFRHNMNDIFVGLLGRRNTMSAVPAWRGERKGNFFSKDRRLRF
ncbi:tachykinin-3b [Triplophysa dalaica]|uniref:tachykinin-3b n=1 Tax=Triplophysa dalaica TaxID=1582913 RepID=UPI0024DF7985|nr:tachykinin-3b [Triplophysa dalaica]